MVSQKDVELRYRLERKNIIYAKYMAVDILTRFRGIYCTFLL